MISTCFYIGWKLEHSLNLSPNTGGLVEVLERGTPTMPLNYKLGICLKFS